MLIHTKGTNNTRVQEMGIKKGGEKKLVTLFEGCSTALVFSKGEVFDHSME